MEVSNHSVLFVGDDNFFLGSSFFHRKPDGAKLPKSAILISLKSNRIFQVFFHQCFNRQFSSCTKLLDKHMANEVPCSGGGDI